MRFSYSRCISAFVFAIDFPPYSSYNITKKSG
nr:MAG TPA: hypothetical protein [Caudoviricetes sp.]